MQGPVSPGGVLGRGPAHALPADQAALGDAAHDRGLRTDPRPARWAAACVSLGDPGGVASLLDGLRQAGAPDQAASLLDRDPAAQVSLGDPGGVASLLVALRAAGAAEPAAVLIGRLPGVGTFKLFLEQQGDRDRFRFGREADGGPATPWAGTIWTDAAGFSPVPGPVPRRRWFTAALAGTCPVSGMGSLIETVSTFFVRRADLEQRRLR